MSEVKDLGQVTADTWVVADLSTLGMAAFSSSLHAIHNELVTTVDSTRFCIAPLTTFLFLANKPSNAVSELYKQF